METFGIKYAEALFDIAKDEIQVKNYQEQLDLVATVFNDESVMCFLTSYQIDKDTKKKMLKETFNQAIDDMIINFLCLIIDRHRMNKWSLIHQSFHDLCNEYLGIEEGIVYSVNYLQIEEKQHIEQALSKHLQKQIILSNAIDKTLIGGIKVVIKEHVFDDSITSRIEQLKSELLESR